VDATAEASETAWQLALAEARGGFQEIHIEASGFVEHAETCRREGARPEHLADLFLAWAAARGDQAALRRLERYVVADVEGAARRVDRDTAFVDEVRQRLRVHLLVPNPSGRARIEDYVGRGPLRGWIGVTAHRLALNLKREAPTAASGDDVLTELVAAEPDAELRQMKTQYRAEFREAVVEALAQLPDRERVLLRLHYVEGLRLLQIARLYQVHESTASRWLSQAAEKVADDTRHLLVGRLSLSPRAADSLARMVLSRLDLSIARLLGGAGSR
jgi:RNA polymerase sigma-70 factor, ECF subfamily